MTSFYCIDKGEWARLCPFCKDARGHQLMFIDGQRQQYREHLLLHVWKGDAVKLKNRQR